MNYEIKSITNEAELESALVFVRKVFSHLLVKDDFTAAFWADHMKKCSDLLLYAKCNGEVAGIAFTFIENDENATIRMVAVDEKYRGQGIAREMMQMTEKHAKAHGISRLTLGAAEGAEDFYAKLGYEGSLLVQSEEYSIDDMLAFNTKYRVVGTNVYDGTVNQVFIDLPIVNRDFQHEYERAFPGCSTRMIYGKSI